MDILKQYTIQWKGLANGSHHFDFEVGDAFFREFESPDIKRGNARVSVDLEKMAGMLLAHVAIEGEVWVECDRCLEELMIPVDYEGELKVKFSEETDDYDGDIMWISPGEGELPLAQYIYESIVLSLPYSRVHGEDGEGNPLCDEDMLGRFEIISGEEFDLLTDDTESLEKGPEGDKLRELKDKLEKEDNK